jgi:hypothetical protein
MDLAGAMLFICSTRLAVISTINLKGRPEAVLIGLAFDPAFCLASEPQGEDLRRAKELYFSIRQDGRDREMWPDITYVLIKPQWLRYTEYGGTSELSEFIGPF